MTTTAAVARQESGPAGLVRQYQSDFAMVLPSHVKPDTFTRLVLGALRRDPKLNEAAGNNPAAFLGAVLDAARLGHEPGTEAYYLVPRKRKGRLEVQGIEGYQGIVERIYRAGAVSSVVVEVVRERDQFTYVVGRDDRPVHEVDWFGEDRGPLVGVYAYAVMKDGATSKVVVLNRAHIAALRAKSDGANSEYSPWQTNEEAMWLKSAARQLRKWTPTSAEYVAEMLRAQASAVVVADTVGAPPLPAADPTTGEIETVDGELVDDDPMSYSELDADDRAGASA